MKVWDLETQKVIYTFNNIIHSIGAIAVTPNNQKIISGSDNNTLQLRDLSTGKEVLKLTGHSQSVIALTITPDGEKVISSSADYSLKVWDLKSGKEIFTKNCDVRFHYDLAITPDGKHVISALYQIIAVYNLSNSDESFVIDAHTTYINAVAVTPNGMQIISASSDKTIIEAPSQILDLAEYPQQNHEDVEAYIRQYVNNSEQLIGQLIAKSENNFMYTSAWFDCAHQPLSDHLSQILPAISKMFDGLPPGLEAYYQQHLHKMIPPNSPTFERKLKSFVLSVLVQVSSPLSAEVIASAIDADEYDVEEVLENWREFLTLQDGTCYPAGTLRANKSGNPPNAVPQIDGEIRYSLYHSSFRDFLSKQVSFG